MTLCVFRADSSIQIGSGHVMRCLALADALGTLGATSTFICRPHDGHIGEVIAKRGHGLRWLPSPSAPARADEYATWVGASWQDDASQTAEILQDIEPDWLVVDHYGLDRRWEAAVSGRAGHMLAIDDLANRPHAGEVLLDQSIGGSDRYAMLVEPACLKLLGPDYALLSPSYRSVRQKAQRRKGSVRTLLIYFGGSDVADLTGRSLDAFLSLGRNDIACRVVMGPNYAHSASLQAAAKPHANVTILANQPSLDTQLLKADLCIGAAGTVSWERLCARLPALVIALAPNQAYNVQTLHQAGFVRHLGDVAIKTETIAEALVAQFAGRLETLWPALADAPVDGLGALRTATIMLGGPKLRLRARPVTAGDEKLLLEWANDPVTRGNAFNPAPILPADHRNWLARRLANPKIYHLRIVETTDGIAVGHARFEPSDDGLAISYVIAPDFRGRGLGFPVLDVAIASLALQDATDLVGFVKPGNVASARIFGRLGFNRAFEDEAAIKFVLPTRALPKP